MISGHIFADAEPLPGIAVSNGTDIVRSAADGSYTLDDATEAYPFVFVNLPAGMKNDGAFFQRVSGTGPYDFRLRAAPQRTGDGVRIAHVTDIHIGAPPNEVFVTPEAFAADLRRVIDEAQPDLVVITGDLTNLGKVEELEAYREVVSQFETPIISLTAGHDYLEEIVALRSEPGRELGARRTHQILGVEQYSFDWGPYHFVLYPETHGDPTRAARLRRFMQNDLAMQPAGTPVVIITHDPPRAFPEKQPEDYGPSLIEILQYPTVPLIVHGQYHIARIIRHKGTLVIGIPCLSMGAIDYHAPAYGLYELWKGVPTVSLRPLLNENVASPSHDRAAPGQTFAGMSLAWTRGISGSFHRANAVVVETSYGEAGDRKSLIMPASDMGNPALYGIYSFEAANGATRWFTPTVEVVKNGCVIAGDSIVAVTVAGMVYRIDAQSGAVRWQSELPTYPDRWIHSRPIVESDRIYITNYAVRSCVDLNSGAVIWNHHEAGLVDNAYAAPYQEPVLHRGMIWQLDMKFALMMIDVASGAIVNRIDLDFTEENKAVKGERTRIYQGQIASPILAGDRIISPGAADQIGVIDTASGALLWLKPVLSIEGKASLGGDGRSTRPREFTCGLAAGDDGRFFATSASGDVFCIEIETGEVVWRTHLGDAGIADMVPYYRGRGLLLTRPILDAGRLFVGGSDGVLYALSMRDGSIESRVFLGSPITAPPVVDDHSVTAFCYNGSVWRFEVSI